MLSSKKEDIINLDIEIKEYIIYLYEEYKNNYIGTDELLYTSNEILIANGIQLSYNVLIQAIEYLYLYKLKEIQRIEIERAQEEEKKKREQDRLEYEKKIEERNKYESKVRYLNNQVVSTKGEKYIIEKDHLSEEMKKTYINIKPFKKFRFH